mmetsp:Transcript_51064/g.84807  ORF Transcript_51064/g.84807 Transcript_51064/m.84807 type:complete len:217 (-) Transcript_51064:135-785(-)
MVESTRDVLEVRWKQCLEELSIDNTQRWWIEIASHYEESWRRYHNLCHLKELFLLWDELVPNFERKWLIALAIFFHDVIYEPSRNDNEERSADLASQFCDEAKQPSDLASALVSIILATKSHTMASEASIGADGMLFLDMDLAVLGRNPQDYERYALQIREEYLCYDDAAFKAGRARALKTMLANKQLYHTMALRERFEARARGNMSRELRVLEDV